MRLLASLFCMVAFLGSVANADDGKDAAVKLIKQVIEKAKKDGKDAAIAAVNKGEFTKGESYATIYDLEGKCVAHGSKPARVGQNLLGEKDPDGKLFVKERIEMAKAKGSGWQTYRFQNPVSKKIENKEAYFETADGLVYSAGAYSK